MELKDYVTAASAMVAAIGLLIAVRRDRLLRRKEYADRIRQAAAATAVAMDRWAELALRLYDDVQPLITDADAQAVETQKLVKVRDTFWRGIMAARANATRKITDEKIGSAYVGLFGYDSDIHLLYTKVISNLKELEEIAFARLASETQRAILDLEGEEPFHSAQLGNRLRGVVGFICSDFEKSVKSTIDPFRERMLMVISASDEDIFAKAYPSLKKPNKAPEPTP